MTKHLIPKVSRYKIFMSNVHSRLFNLFGEGLITDLIDILMTSLYNWPACKYEIEYFKERYFSKR